MGTGAGTYPEGSNVDAAWGSALGEAEPPAGEPLPARGVVDDPSEHAWASIAASPVTPMCNTPRRRTGIPPWSRPNYATMTVPASLSPSGQTTERRAWLRSEPGNLWLCDDRAATHRQAGPARAGPARRYRDRRVLLAPEPGRPGHGRLPRGRERVHRRGDRPPRAAARDAVQRDQVAHQGDRP